jgi:hypothetical protein
MTPRPPALDIRSVQRCSECPGRCGRGHAAAHLACHRPLADVSRTAISLAVTARAEGEGSLPGRPTASARTPPPQPPHTAGPPAGRTSRAPSAGPQVPPRACPPARTRPRTGGSHEGRERVSGRGDAQHTAPPSRMPLRYALGPATGRAGPDPRPAAAVQRRDVAFPHRQSVAGRACRVRLMVHDLRSLPRLGLKGRLRARDGADDLSGGLARAGGSGPGQRGLHHAACPPPCRRDAAGHAAAGRAGEGRRRGGKGCANGTHAAPRVW